GVLAAAPLQQQGNQEDTRRQLVPAVRLQRVAPPPEGGVDEEREEVQRHAPHGPLHRQAGERQERRNPGERGQAHAVASLTVGTGDDAAICRCHSWKVSSASSVSLRSSRYCSCAWMKPSTMAGSNSPCLRSV